MDTLDLKILQALQNNGRKRNSDLAKELGVAPSTMLERVRRLEETGTLKGYRATIDSKKLGFGVQAFVSLILSRHEAKIIKEFEEEIKNTPHIRACYNITGRFDYILHVCVHDLDQLGNLIKSDIMSLPGVVKSETFIIFTEIKPDTGLPLADELVSGE